MRDIAALPDRLDPTGHAPAGGQIPEGSAARSPTTRNSGGCEVKGLLPAAWPFP